MSVNLDSEIIDTRNAHPPLVLGKNCVRILRPKMVLDSIKKLLVAHPVRKIAKNDHRDTVTQPHVQPGVISNDGRHINDPKLNRHRHLGGDKMLRVTPTQYIFPPRAEHCVPKDLVDMYFDQGWMAQIKYNDTRLLLKILPDKFELWNRHGMRINYTPNDSLIAQINAIRDKLNIKEWALLDGGLLDAKHAAIKDQIVLWDILVHDGVHLLNTTYDERFARILDICGKSPTPHYYTPTHGKHQPLDIGYAISSDIFCPRWYNKTEYNQLWELVTTANTPYPTPVFEGCVMKDPNGTLTVGYKAKNNTEWMVKSRVTTGRHRF